MATAVVVPILLSVIGLWLLATRFLDTGQAAVADEIRLGTATFLIGSFGAGASVFLGKVGLKGFTELPKLVFTNAYTAMYILIGGGIAVLFWLTAPLTFAPLYSAGIGAAWPAAIAGLVSVNQSRKVADDQVDEIKKLLGAIG